jgi:uncharacterized membrane protein/protein-disulfide isomerase
MSSFVPLVPNASRSGVGFRSIASAAEPAFPAPVRWTLRVLAWLAFGVASYLALTALSQTSVAGCNLGAHVNCDAVLSSSWSKFLGIPVSFLGLACYATLAALSVLLGLHNATANRWISTVFIALSIVAAGASIWFIAVQVFSIKIFCLYCLIIDVCGIALGIVATAFAVRAVLAERSMPQPRTVQTGLMALRTALPGSARNPQAMPQTATSQPWLLPAVGVAIPMLALLIGGQILFPYQTYGLEKADLKDTIAMDGSKTDGKADGTSEASTHVAMRVSPGSDTDEKNPPADPPNDKAAGAAKDSGKSTAADEKNAAAQPPPEVPAEPAKKRLVKVLNGKLTLDTYQHPIIGSPEAPHVAVEMVSYDCPHCRKMAATMQHALERYGDQVALLVIIIPFESSCNKLLTDPAANHPGACDTAKLGLSIAKVNPTAFGTFHEFLMSTKDKPPLMGAIRSKAYVLADRSQVRELAEKDETAKKVEAYVNLFGRLQKQSEGNKKFGLPIQILGDFIMTGEVEKEEDVFKAWEEHLGVKPQ